MTSKALVAAGMTYRQLDFWVTNGLIRPLKQHPGYGSLRVFSPTEAGVARLMAMLVRAGVNPHAAHHAARNDGRIAPGVRIVLDEEAA